MEFAFCDAKSQVREISLQKREWKSQIVSPSGGHSWGSSGHVPAEGLRAVTPRSEKEERSCRIFVVQSGEKNIGIAILMPKGSGVSALNVTSAVSVSRVNWSSPVWCSMLGSVSSPFRRSSENSTLNLPFQSFPVRSGQFHHPDIWNAAGGTVPPLVHRWSSGS